MKTYVFSTPNMAAGVLIQAENLKACKVKILSYLCAKRLPNHTTIEEYLFAY